MDGGYQYRTETTSFLSRLAARVKIGELQRGVVTAEVKSQIISLALAASIASNCTEFHYDQQLRQK